MIEAKHDPSASEAGPRISRVLVVDDERDIRTVAEMSLKTIAGWETTLAASGDEALEAARTQSYDVVLLDMMMPGRDGLSTLQELRKLEGWGEIPVIMVTAKAQRHEIRSYFDAGAAGVITKPFDPIALASRVRQLVEDAVRRPRPTPPTGLSERLAALRVDYLARLPQKLDEIEKSCHDWVASPGEPTYALARTAAHKLHGTAGSYALAEVSSAAGRLEAVILGVGVAGTPEGPAVEGAIAQLREIAEAAAAAD